MSVASRLGCDIKEEGMHGIEVGVAEPIEGFEQNVSGVSLM